MDKLASNGTVVLNAAPKTATTVQITDAKTGTADVLNLVTNVATANVDFKTLNAAEIETVNITANDTQLDNNNDGKIEPAGLDAVETAILSLVATKATKITVTGNSNLNLTNTGNTKVAEIDGSTMTGALTVTGAGTTATTIKGGSGADVLTASSTAGGQVAQVSTIKLTDGSGTAGLGFNDTMSVKVGGTAFTYTHTADADISMDDAAAALKDLIHADAAYIATYDAGADTITVTAAVAGTPFTLTNYAVTDKVGTNATGTALTYDNDAAGTNAVGQKSTIAVTQDDVHSNNEAVTVTWDTDGSSAGGTTATLDVNLTAAATKATVISDMVTALNNTKAFSDVATASATADALVVMYKNTQANTDASVAIKAGSTINGLAFAAAVSTAAVQDIDTVVVTNAFAADKLLDKSDKLSITVDPDGAGNTAGVVVEYTVATDAMSFDDAMTALATAIVNKAELGDITAAYTAGTDTLAVTDAASADVSGLVLSAFTVTDVATDQVVNTTGTSAVFATTTANVTTSNAGDTLIGNDGHDTLIAGPAMATMTGGAGNDVFVINSASTNVNSYSTITDFAAGDLIQFNGADSFAASKVTLGATAVFQDYANAAMNAIGANDVAWFQFDNNTYIVMDVVTTNSTTFINGEDFIVKLTGLVDLSTATFNATEGTIGLA